MRGLIHGRANRPGEPKLPPNGGRPDRTGHVKAKKQNVLMREGRDIKMRELGPLHHAPIH